MGNPVLAELVRSHERFVVGCLRRSGVAPADAEDVAQEVFIAVHAQPETFAERSSLRAWLKGICRNKAKDYRRKNHRRRSLFAAKSCLPEREQSDPLAELVRQESAARLQRGLLRLPVLQRQVLELHELNGMPMQEIAARLGCPLDTAYGRYRTGRARLRSIIEREDARHPGDEATS